MKGEQQQQKNETPSRQQREYDSTIAWCASCTALFSSPTGRHLAIDVCVSNWRSEIRYGHFFFSLFLLYSTVLSSKPTQLIFLCWDCFCNATLTGWWKRVSQNVTKWYDIIVTSCQPCAPVAHVLTHRPSKSDKVCSGMQIHNVESLPQFVQIPTPLSPLFSSCKSHILMLCNVSLRLP